MRLFVPRSGLHRDPDEPVPLTAVSGTRRRDDRPAEGVDADIRRGRRSAAVVGTLRDRSGVAVAIGEHLGLECRCRGRGVDRRGAAQHGDAGHHETCRIFEPALRRMKRESRGRESAPRDIDSDAVIGPLIDRPSELANQPRRHVLRPDRFGLRISGCGLASGCVRHAADLHRRVRQQTCQANVGVTKIDLVTVGSPGMREVDGARSERSRRRRIRWQAAEVDILQGRGEIVSTLRVLHAGEQPVRGKCVLVVAAAGRRLEEAPHFDAGPVAKCPGRGRWRCRRILSCRRRRGHKD